MWPIARCVVVVAMGDAVRGALPVAAATVAPAAGSAAAAGGLLRLTAAGAGAAGGWLGLSWRFPAQSSSMQQQKPFYSPKKKPFMERQQQQGLHLAAVGVQGSGYGTHISGTVS